MAAWTVCARTAHCHYNKNPFYDTKNQFVNLGQDKTHWYNTQAWKTKKYILSKEVKHYKKKKVLSSDVLS